MAITILLRTHSPLLLIVLMSAPVVTVADAQAPANEAQVRSVIERLVDAMNARDAVAVSQFYTPDGDRFDGTTGGHAKGRDAVAAMYRALFERLPVGARASTAKSGSSARMWRSWTVLLRWRRRAHRLPSL